MATRIGAVEFVGEIDGRKLPAQARVIGERTGATMGTSASRAFKDKFDASPAIGEMMATARSMGQRFGESMGVGANAGFRERFSPRVNIARILESARRVGERHGQTFAGGANFGFREAFDPTPNIARMLESATTAGYRYGYTFGRAANTGFRAGFDPRPHIGRLEAGARAAGERYGGAFARRANHTSRQTLRMGANSRALGRNTAALNAHGAASGRAATRANLFTRSVRRLGMAMKNFGNRGDLTPRIIVALILTLGESIFTLASGVSAAFTAMLSSVALAVGGLAVIAGPALAGLVWTLGHTIGALKVMKEEFPAAQAAMGRLATAAKNDSRAFARAWGPALARFSNALVKLWTEDEMGERAGEAMAKITDAFTGVLNSDSYKRFEAAMETSIPRAIANLGVAGASVVEGLLSLFSAAAPYLERISETFLGWADGWRNKMNQIGESEGFHTFMERALNSLKSVLNLVDSIGDFLGTVFLAGAEHGDALFDSIAGAFREWNDFLRSAEGQDSLNKWFENGRIIMESFGGLLSKTGKMMADVVTQESVGRLTDFMDGLGDSMAMLGEVITFFGELNILNLVLDALGAIGAGLEPLMPVLHEFAAIFAGELSSALKSLEGPMRTLGNALIPVVRFITNLVKILLPPLAKVIGTVVTAVAKIIDALFGWADVTGESGEAAKIFWGILEGIADFLGNTLSAAITAVGGIISATVALLQGDFSGMFEALRDMFFGILEAFGITEEGFLAWFDDVSRGFAEFFAGIFTGFVGFFADIMNGLANFIADVTMGWINFWGTLFDPNFWLDIWDSIVQWFKDMQDSFNSWVSDIGKAWGDFWNGLSKVAEDIIGGIKDFIDTLFAPIKWLLDSLGKINAQGWNGGDPLTGFGTGGSSGGFAAGGVLSGARRILAGEAGPEAIVPLRRPLGSVDPSVRWLSAIAQNKATPAMASGGIVGGGRTVNVNPGAIIVNEARDPLGTSIEILDRFARNAV